MILLLNPKVISTRINKLMEPFIFSSMPISLGFLAGYLETKGIKSKILDEQLKDFSYDFLKKEISKLDSPKIIGMSVVTSTYKRSCEIARMIKKIDPLISIILGGIHPTAAAEECLGEPFFDIVVRGEGEQALHGIIICLKKGKSLAEVAGISYKDNNQIVNNPNGALIANLDDIPPFPYHLFEDNIKNYKNFGIIISSRGCPYKCIFCSSRLISRHKSTISMILSLK